MNRHARGSIDASGRAAADASGRIAAEWMRAMLLAVATCATALPAHAAPATPLSVPLSSYDDDPFANDSVVERVSRRLLERDHGRLVLSNDRMRIEDEPYIYRLDRTIGRFYAFAWNPWSPELEEANADGNFAFPDEPRFPLHRVERGPDGKIVLRDGLQVWLPQDLHRGMTTTFEAVNAVKESGELWLGRDVVWGAEGLLEINTHAFIDFNAFYSPSGRALFFGVVPHRLPGEPSTAPVKMFEMATGWEIAAHEAGHALHAGLKPNQNPSGPGYRTWGESFGDQIAMWTSLRDPDRVRGLLADTNGDLNQSNALTRIGEAFAAFIGAGTGLRDAFHDKRVSDTTEEVHDRSEVLTGAAYRLFLAHYDRLRSERGREDAMRKAGRIMGTYLVRVVDFTPENDMTLEDVAKAYLKVDKEFFGGRHHALLVDELTRRELLDAEGLNEWMVHEASLPDLELPTDASDPLLAQLVQANLDRLGIDPEFGLRLQSVLRVRRGMTIVRVQLTSGRGPGAAPLDNHGILAFRADGTLADYHPPVPPDSSAGAQAGARTSPPLRSLLAEAARARLDQHGAPVAVVRRPDGSLTAEARVLRGEGMHAHMEVFTLDAPGGERREVIVPPVPPALQLRVAADLLE